MDELTYGVSGKRKERNKQIEIVYNDIAMIEDALKTNDFDYLKVTHMIIDGKYSNVLPNIGMSCYSYFSDIGFDYNYLDVDSLKHNLTIIKSKLESYAIGFPMPTKGASPQNIIDVSVTNKNDISIAVSFEEAKQKIEDMPGLNDSDTEEIKEKIDELQNINQEKISKKKKWEKVKPILAFAADKGADVAIAIMGLILQMKLGM